MSILRQVQNGSDIPCVKNIRESDDYLHMIRLAYREQRRLIEEFQPKSNMAKAAARQARKLLHMHPEVQHGNMKAVRDLAIKTWNYKFTEAMQELICLEASLNDEITNAVNSFITEPVQITNPAEIEKILNLARVQQQRSIKTVNGTVRVVHYTYRGGHFVAVEKPTTKPDLYKGEQQ